MGFTIKVCRVRRSCVVAALLAGLLAVPVFAQTSGSRPVNLEGEFNQVFEQIQALKSSGADVPSDLYTRFFELESTLYPDRVTHVTGSLDELYPEDACPGLRIVQPPSGPFHISLGGETYSMADDCGLCRRYGRDVIYELIINHPAWIQINTCGSGFDTYLCVFADSCCRPGSVALYRNDDAPEICGPNSLRSAINHCFEDTGRYYIILDGYNASAAGHYVLNVFDIPDSACGPTPEIECPANFFHHEEGAEEGVCQHGVSVNCGDGYCGAIEPLGDLDVYTFTIMTCQIVTLSVYANDTPGRSGTGHGLDPIVRLFSDPSCDHPLYINDDFHGTQPDPVGHDSRIVTECLRPGTYWFEIAGKASTGLYEFTIECTPCPWVPPIQSTVTHPSEGQNCVNWSPVPGATIYYVWRIIPGGGPWMLVGTVTASPFCESGPPSAVYEVFPGPCGQPGIDR